MTNHCDECEQEVEWAEMHVAAVPRPSDPTELVSVMAACDKCEPSWPTRQQIMDEYERTETWAGRHYWFVSL